MKGIKHSPFNIVTKIASLESSVGDYGASISSLESSVVNNSSDIADLQATPTGDYSDVIKDDYIQMNTTPTTPPSSKGAVYWDEQDETLTVIINDAGVKLQLGQEQYVMAVNKTGSTINNGEVVYISGAQGNRPKISLADCDNATTSSKTIGLVTEEIRNNMYGKVTTFGLVRDLDTSDYDEGDCVWLSSTPGKFTNVKPEDGKLRYRLGMVMKSHVTDGWICVKIQDIKYMFGKVDDGSYTYFEEDGTMVSKGDATTWEDLQFSVSGGKVPAVNAPNFETFTANTKEYSFDVGDFIYLNANEPFHSYKLDSTADIHVHGTVKTANTSGSSQYIKYQVFIGYVYDNAVWNETSITGECEVPDGTSALTMKICNIGNLVLTDDYIGGQIKLTLKRIAATGGTEYADSVFITQVGMHIEQDTNGSRNEYIK